MATSVRMTGRWTFRTLAHCVRMARSTPTGASLVTTGRRGYDRATGPRSAIRTRMSGRYCRRRRRRVRNETNGLVFCATSRIDLNRGFDTQPCTQGSTKRFLSSSSAITVSDPILFIHPFISICPVYLLLAHLRLSLGAFWGNIAFERVRDSRFGTTCFPRIYCCAAYSPPFHILHTF